MTAVTTLAGSQFVDLYISKTFADVKGLAGAEETRIEVPQSWEPEIKELRALCAQRFEESKSPEFAVIKDGIAYRVTHLDWIESGGVFVLRRFEAQIRNPHGLGLSRNILDAVLAQDASGLVLICGGMGAGKTTTAASFVVERLKMHGGMALGIEDPTETSIDGIHGKGRCIAISASRYNGGYREHLIRGLRSGVDFIFIGEIRDGDTAFEALKAGANGKLIIATLHGGSETLALDRLIILASQHTDTAADMLADSLLAILWQNLDEEPKSGGGTFKVLTSSGLVLKGDQETAIREKIRRRELSALAYEIDRQAQKNMWNS